MNNDSTNPAAAPAADQTDYDKPVAYDNQGRPLYARPPQVATAQASQQSQAEQQPQPQQQPASTPQQFHQQAQHQYVHVSRPISPDEPDIPPEIMQLYEESRRKYPRLNLSKGEFIISAVQRHPIGIIQIWIVAFIFIGALGAVLMNFLTGNNTDNDTLLLAASGLGLFAVLVFAGALVATYIYNGNHFFLTNESVIQEIQNSLFSNHEQTVSLSNIEDASFRQDGILPHMLNYGTIRLSTEGDETTYRFSYVSNPKKQIAILNNAVENFKNGRPVLPTEDQPSIGNKI